MSVAEAAAAAGKYLTFGLAGEVYGLDILRVQEIVGLMPVTRVPRLPDSVAGVVNLRGRVIPVVELRRALGIEPTPSTERTCIIIAAVRRDEREAVMGFVVDEVADVVALTDDIIEPTPEFGAVDTAFLRGVGRVEDRVVLLLEIDEVLKHSETGLIERAANSADASDMEG